jgi:septal ring factor EnvC (AmiA/AmiB activator)
MQSDPSAVQATPAPKKFNFLIVVVVILILALAGAGYWGFQQSTALKATQSELASLQGKYDSLTAENGKLTTELGAANTELASTKTELEKTTTNLTSAQTDLKASTDKNTGLQTKLGTASKKAEIMYALSSLKTTEDFIALDALIKASNDNNLIAKWTAFKSTPTAEESAKFLLYLMGAIRDDLK